MHSHLQGREEQERAQRTGLGGGVSGSNVGSSASRAQDGRINAREERESKSQGEVKSRSKSNTME